MSKKQKLSHTLSGFHEPILSLTVDKGHLSLVLYRDKREDISAISTNEEDSVFTDEGTLEETDSMDEVDSFSEEETDSMDEVDSLFTDEDEEEMDFPVKVFPVPKENFTTAFRSCGKISFKLPKSKPKPVPKSNIKLNKKPAYTYAHKFKRVNGIPYYWVPPYTRENGISVDGFWRRYPYH